jgi:hypothetical protein
MKKTYKNKKKYIRNKQTRKKIGKYIRKRGGKAVAAGSYGCIFNPALRCEHKHKQEHKQEHKQQMISKLMETAAAKNEMKEINEVLSHIKNIPHNDNYFLVQDVNMCTPAELSISDLVDFDKTCNDIVKYNKYDHSNINNHLKNFKIINMPNGGIDMDHYWKKIMKLTKLNQTKEYFSIGNMALIKLVKEGIVPLNKLGFYHLDVKAGNILISDYARLIDWGLAQKLNRANISSKQSKLICEFQFNVPFANILLNPKLDGWLKEAFASKVDLPLQKIAEFICYKSIEDKGRGHLDFIKYYYLIINKEALNVTTIDELIYAYITEILLKYVNKSSGKFDVNKYCLEVFLPNVDIWGFLMTYMPIIEMGMSLNELQPIASELGQIIMKYCYTTKYAVRPIPVEAVIQDLTLLI